MGFWRELGMNDGPTTSSRIPPRVVRVFLSSTFRDMQREREELVKRVFPALQRLCRARGLVCAEVDLRWGIVENRSIVPVCLREIERSNCFVGIIGSRYGTPLSK